MARGGRTLLPWATGEEPRTLVRRTRQPMRRRAIRRSRQSQRLPRLRRTRYPHHQMRRLETLHQRECPSRLRTRTEIRAHRLPTRLRRQGTLLRLQTAHPARPHLAIRSPSRRPATMAARSPRNRPRRTGQELHPVTIRPRTLPKTPTPRPHQLTKNQQLLPAMRNHPPMTTRLQLLSQLTTRVRKRPDRTRTRGTTAGEGTTTRPTTVAATGNPIQRPQRTLLRPHLIPL